jgi:hypothetical protein
LLLLHAASAGRQPQLLLLQLTAAATTTMQGATVAVLVQRSWQTSMLRQHAGHLLLLLDNLQGQGQLLLLPACLTVRSHMTVKALLLQMMTAAMRKGHRPALLSNPAARAAAKLPNSLLLLLLLRQGDAPAAQLAMGPVRVT